MMRFIVTIDDHAAETGQRCGQCGADKELAMLILDVEKDGKFIRTVKEAICGKCFVRGMEAKCPGFAQSVNNASAGL